jgi:hypothetical protein
MSKETIYLSEQKETGIITDGEGYGYYGLREIVEHIKATELEGQELDFDEVLRLALFAYNNHETDLALLTAERLAEILEQEQDAYAGEYSTEADFAEDLADQLGMVDEEATKFLVIDWQGTYNYSFQWDYYNFTVRLNDEENGIFYARYFWRSN